MTPDPEELLALIEEKMKKLLRDNEVLREENERLKEFLSNCNEVLKRY